MSLVSICELHFEIIKISDTWRARYTTVGSGIVRPSIGSGCELIVRHKFSHGLKEEHYRHALSNWSRYGFP